MNCGAMSPPTPTIATRCMRLLAPRSRSVSETKAQRHFRDCLKLRPDYVRAWRDCLADFLEQGELDRFLAMLRVPPPSADNDPETWFFRGVASEKAGDWRMAASHFQKAIDLNPFLNKCYYRLGMADGRLGLHEQAAANRKKSIGDQRGTWSASSGLRDVLRQFQGQGARSCGRSGSGPAPGRDLRDARLGPARPGVEPRGRRPE